MLRDRRHDRCLGVEVGTGRGRCRAVSSRISPDRRWSPPGRCAILASARRTWDAPPHRRREHPEPARAPPERRRWSPGGTRPLVRRGPAGQPLVQEHNRRFGEAEVVGRRWLRSGADRDGDASARSRIRCTTATASDPIRGTPAARVEQDLYRSRRTGAVGGFARQLRNVSVWRPASHQATGAVEGPRRSWSSPGRRARSAPAYPDHSASTGGCELEPRGPSNRSEPSRWWSCAWARLHELPDGRRRGSAGRTRRAEAGEATSRCQLMPAACI